MKYYLTFHIIHIPGTWMVKLGVDYGFQGATWEKGSSWTLIGSLLDHVPMYLGLVQQSPDMICWLCNKLFNVQEEDVLKPEDWFVKGHDVVGWEC
jgi:hypothetical protein